MTGRSVRSTAAAVVLTVVAAAVAGCSGDQDADPAAVPPSSQAPAASADAALAATTRTTIGEVAGRLGPDRRQEVKGVVGGIVERYLDAAFLAGDYPRDDFAAAFVDFRKQVAESAAGADLDLLTNHAIGARVTEVQATRRRVRVDVLAPEGRPSAATARFLVRFDTEGEVAGSHEVTGSLFLSNQRGAWKVFGYDVRAEVAS